MNNKYCTSIKRVLVSLTIFSVLGALIFSGRNAWADDRQEGRQLVDKSQLMMESLRTDQNFTDFRTLIKQAKGVFLIPELLKGAFVVGASGGTGVLLVRDEKNSHWNGPAFYTVGGVSWGLQIGAESSEMVLLLMTQRGVSSFLTNSLKLGADVGVAAGPVGFGTSVATANLSADILSFSRSKGLYAGISLHGALIATRDSLNDAYYGKKITPTDILIRREVFNSEAAKLIEEIAKAESLNKEEVQK
jgi:SH3 domain-containing YSC84-like protein 1